MIDYQSLTNLPEINFRSKERPALQELAQYIDEMKAGLFDDKWTTATKHFASKRQDLFNRYASNLREAHVGTVPRRTRLRRRLPFVHA